mmetsp:Transcript_81545/g.149442  ORF Transcript_81545/g.149442 Transcript_81545/m.149442 type:complete len:113 (+) Transcript_81545:1260-1598(+)
MTLVNLKIIVAAGELPSTHCLHIQSNWIPTRMRLDEQYIQLATTASRARPIHTYTVTHGIPPVTEKIFQFHRPNAHSGWQSELRAASSAASVSAGTAERGRTTCQRSTGWAL